MSLITARGATPQLGEDVFVAEGAKIIGDVKIGDRSSIWFNTTLRGDVMPITIGTETNIQDGSVLHGTYGKYACEIGDRVTIGHSVVLHGCKIGTRCLIGMGSIVMDGAEVGEFSVVGAGSLVTEGKKFPPRSLIVGRPAAVKRPLTEEELRFLEQSADNYLLYKTWYK
ncbi:gamma carbonic anhydrase family protein [Pseudobdellovibrio exovorus]|uniref:Transferase family protein n=1 Tax=Pseudobdellovibrio exovorus JSS TaxID=1184267 RepID=M4V8I7_9BACT|nr:gamma carbonic anhydrase family protein [Pseudobdellovibrio exovorus]AGH95503.1 transferase family protein [Pseudobdellovibrio exovorus JSS]